MTDNSLTLSDKLVLTTLTILIPYQKEKPIKILDIANVSGVSPRTVTNVLHRLRARGIISTDRPHTGTNYTYSVHEDKVPSFDTDSLLARLPPF